jgi:hypothetical protein
MERPWGTILSGVYFLYCPILDCTVLLNIILRCSTLCCDKSYCTAPRCNALNGVICEYSCVLVHFGPCFAVLEILNMRTT